MPRGLELYQVHAGDRIHRRQATVSGAAVRKTARISATVTQSGPDYRYGGRLGAGPMSMRSNRLDRLRRPKPVDTRGCRRKSLTPIQRESGRRHLFAPLFAVFAPGRMAARAVHPGPNAVRRRTNGITRGFPGIPLSQLGYPAYNRPSRRRPGGRVARPSLIWNGSITLISLGPFFRRPWRSTRGTAIHWSMSRAAG